MQEAKKRARRLYGKLIIIDDEKYFGLSRDVMTCNRFYYQEKGFQSIEQSQFMTRQKHEPKVLLWIAGSERGMLDAYIVPSGTAIKKENYTNECLRKRLLPFVSKLHANTNFLFWPA